MQRDAYREELARFLRYHREKIQPEDVSLPRTKRRRTPGLRREEVAMLATISPSVYTRLEQGDNIRVSMHTLERIAQALQLNHTAKMHLFNLANGLLPLPPSTSHKVESVIEQMPQTLQCMLDHCHPYPAYVTNLRWDVLLWNQAACRVFVNYPESTPLERNVLYQIFAMPIVQQILVGWETHARKIIYQFRVDYWQQRNNPAFQEIVAILCDSSKEFALWWNTHHVCTDLVTTKEIDHPAVGCLKMEQMVYQSITHPSLRLVLSTPLNDDTEEKLRMLCG